MKPIKNDLTGQRFGKLIAIEPCESPRPWTSYTGSWWRCVCDCGNEKIVNIMALNGGNTLSCGCKKFESHKGPRRQEGMTYASLTLLKRTMDENGHVWWRVGCNKCGKEFTVRARKLSAFRSGCEDCRALDYEW